MYHNGYINYLCLRKEWNGSMKKFTLWMSICVSLLIINACSPAQAPNDLTENDITGEGTAEKSNLSTELKEQDIEEDTSTENHTEASDQIDDEQTYMRDKLSSSFFRDIEVEIEYANGVEYEFEIEEHHGNIKAKVDNELDGEKFTGIEAFDFIFDKMASLTIEKDSDFDYITEQIITAFNLPDDYIEVEVEITFHDGVELEYEAVAE